MTSFSGYRITAQAIQLCRKVVTLPAAGRYVAEVVVEESTGDTYEWSGSSWTPKGKAAPSSGGGGGTVVTSSVPFTDGDTLRRVSVSDASFTSSSNVVATVMRPDQATDGDDRGYLYVTNVVRRYTGGCDLLIAALGWGFDDPVYLPPNETITVVLQVS